MHTIVITNNHAPAHLRQKKNLVQNQNVSQYFDNDCITKNLNLDRRVENVKLLLRFFQKIPITSTALPFFVIF